MKRVLLIGAVVASIVGLSEAQVEGTNLRPNVHQAVVPPVEPKDDDPELIQPGPQGQDGESIEVAPPELRRGEDGKSIEVAPPELRRGEDGE